MAYWNNGAALNDTELANARQWAQGKSWGDIQGMAGSLGGSADQLGQIFGATGQQVKDYGYGQALGTPGYGQYDKFTYQPGEWAAPQSGGSGGGGSQGNPYLDQMAGSITKQFNSNLLENVLPNVRYGAMAAGGFGGSRQGIAEGKAIGDSADGLAAALANLYGSSYENQQNRDLQKYGIDTQASTSRYGTDKSYDLGLRGVDNQSRSIDNALRLGLLGNDTQRYGIDTTAGTARYTSDNSLQGQLAGAAASQANAAASANTANQRLAWDQFQYQDQADWRELGNLASLYKTFSGLNNSDTTTGQNSPFAQFLGGSLTASQLMKLLG